MDNEKRDQVLNSYRTAGIVATYEELLSIPNASRITYYFGDYGSHFFNHGITDEQIMDAYQKALDAMEMDSDAYQSQREFIYRGNVISRMRACLLANELCVGEAVLFVATEPYGGPGDFALRGGEILSIDAEQKTCSIKGRFFDMNDIPLHYVLGRYNMDITEKHYGFKSVEPLFGENESLARHYLHEAEDSWNVKQKENLSSTPDFSMH